MQSLIAQEETEMGTVSPEDTKPDCSENTQKGPLLEIHKEETSKNRY